MQSTSCPQIHTRQNIKILTQNRDEFNNFIESSANQTFDFIFLCLTRHLLKKERRERCNKKFDPLKKISGRKKITSKKLKIFLSSHVPHLFFFDLSSS
jgi:hypothetical protein